MKEYFEILKNCPLFYDIDPSDIGGLLGCLNAKIQLFEKNRTVMAEGSPSNAIGILLSGGLRVVNNDLYGNRVILSEIKPSELFGEAFACAGVQTLPVGVIACADSRVMLIDCMRIIHTCNSNCSFHQKLIFNLMRDLATKTLAFHKRIQVTSKRSTREKLLEFLAMQSREKGSRSFDIPFDRQELADYLEVDRSGLSVEIGKLKKEGIIDCNKKHFTLL